MVMGSGALELKSFPLFLSSRIVKFKHHATEVEVNSYLAFNTDSLGLKAVHNNSGPFMCFRSFSAPGLQS